MPTGLPLSFPPVVNGNPVFCFFVPYSCDPAWEGHGFPINNIGNDRGAIEYVGHDRMPALAPFVMPLQPLSHKGKGGQKPRLSTF